MPLCRLAAQLQFGWETGMTGMGASGGGLFLLSKGLVLLRRFGEFGKGKAAYIVLPSQGKQAIHRQVHAGLHR